VSIPPWLFDELADHVTDRDELIAHARAWSALLAGADEAVRSPRAGRAAGAPLDMPRYRELRARGVGAVPFDKQQRSGFWRWGSLDGEVDDAA
jgi:plasmid stabilization system protein ParE